MSVCLSVCLCVFLYRRISLTAELISFSFTGQLEAKPLVIIKSSKVFFLQSLITIEPIKFYILLKLHGWLKAISFLGQGCFMLLFLSFPFPVIARATAASMYTLIYRLRGYCGRGKFIVNLGCYYSPHVLVKKILLVRGWDGVKS